MERARQEERILTLQLCVAYSQKGRGLKVKGSLRNHPQNKASIKPYKDKPQERKLSTWQWLEGGKLTWVESVGTPTDSHCQACDSC